MVRRLTSLWGAVRTAAAVADLARQSQTDRFGVSGPVTVYLQAEESEVTLRRWNQPLVEVRTRLDAPFGWRIAAEQDEAGIYVVAKRRAIVGGLSRAEFTIAAPPDAYFILKLLNCRLTLDGWDGTLHLPPPDSSGLTRLTPRG